MSPELREEGEDSRDNAVQLLKTGMVAEGVAPFWLIFKRLPKNTDGVNACKLALL